VNRTQDGDPVTRTTVPIRRASPADREALRTFFTDLSARTRYLRFFAALTITPALLRVLSGGGSADAVVATGHDAIIGHGIAADRAGPGGTTITEIGVVVADTWQGHGIGSALVRALIAAAQSRGAGIVAMDVLPGNQRVLAMITSHWPAASIDHSADCLSIRARLPRHKDGQRPARVAGQRPSGSPGIASRSNRQPAHTASPLPIGGPAGKSCALHTLRSAGRPG
jgi:GNAT superfamily N-acetyltransferase